VAARKGLAIAPSVPALLYCAMATVFLIAPLAVLALRSVSADGGGLTLDYYARYLASPSLRQSLANTGLLGLATLAIVLPLAFLFAYGLERTSLRLKGPLAAIAMTPLLVPSLLPAMGLVYLFGRQGLLTPMLGGHVIYGAQGVLLAEVVAAFPHAVIMLRTALSAADGRLYEQARILGASPWRAFLRITLPAARYGLVSAGMVVFTRAITDIGAPAVIGGDFNVLALDVYKQVLGQQNFEMGAVVAMLLLTPSALMMVLERLALRRQAAMISGKSTAYHPEPSRARDGAFLALCGLIALALVGLLAVCQLAALANLWPYDLSLSLQSYDLGRYDGGWSSLLNSIVLAAVTAVVGAAVAFVGAYVAQRTRAAPALRGALSLAALLPAAAPGLALGLAYALFFDDPANPFHFLYGSFAILVIASVVHFYTVAHLTSVSALKALDPEIEPAAQVLGRGVGAVFLRVIAPMSAVTLAEIALYLFVSAMTTVSVVVFLYPADFKLASIAVLNMDDAGDMGPAAAMGMLIFYVNLAVRLVGQGAIGWVRRRSEIPAPTPESEISKLQAA
jgi:iron(III) transport system permease protein